MWVTRLVGNSGVTFFVNHINKYALFYDVIIDKLQNLMNQIQIQNLINLVFISISINNMVRAQNSQSEFVINPKEIKRVQSTESVSTVQEPERGPNSRLLSTEVKAKFIQLITKRNYSMKQAAKKVKMSYSTAKKIYRKFRTMNMIKSIVRIDTNAIQASYSEIAKETRRSIQIICLIAGNSQIQIQPLTP